MVLGSGTGDVLMCQEWDVTFTVEEQLCTVRVGAASYADIRKHLEQLGPLSLVSILHKRDADLLGLIEGEIVFDPPRLH